MARSAGVAGAFTCASHALDTRNGVNASGSRRSERNRSDKLHHGQSSARLTSPAASAFRSTYRQTRTRLAALSMGRA
jgi:hypothetical protein